MIIALLSPSEFVSWLEGRQVHCGSTEAEQLQCGDSISMYHSINDDGENPGASGT